MPGYETEIDDPDDSSKLLKRFDNFAYELTDWTYCVYCGAPLKSESQKNGQSPFRMITIDRTYLGKRCQRCHWWYIQREIIEDSDLSDHVATDLLTYEGIIYKFDLCSGNLAYQDFKQELLKSSKGLISRSPKEVEKMVASIFSEYYNCEVKHIGRSHDKGIDLILIKGDTNIAVQVKHRINSNKVEGVTPVREFVGALVEQGFISGIFVTTATKFSRFAKSFAEGISRSYCPLTLINVKELMDMLGIVEDRKSQYFQLWKDIQK